MKRTVKQWCLHFGFDWYGPGVHGSSKYDYKIIYRDDSGKTSCVGFFASHHRGSKFPRKGEKKGGDFFLFPVYRQVTGQKEMSRRKFRMVSDWVQHCLLDEAMDYTEFLSRLPCDSPANQGTQPEIDRPPCA